MVTSFARSFFKIQVMFFFLVGLAQGQIDWQRYPGNPVVPAWSGNPNDTNPFQYTYGPSVLIDSATGQYKMWFAGLPRSGSAWSVSYATSTDGIAWTLYSQNPVLTVGPSGSFDSQWVIDPNVIFDGTEYKMYYTGYDGSRWQSGLARSIDGITWTKFAGNPIIGVVPNSWESICTSCPSAFFDGIHYTILYSGYDGSHYNLGQATSEDGMNFTKNPTNPVLLRGGPGSWDANSVIGTSLVNTNSKLYIFFNGGSNTPIGFATSSDGGATWTKYPNNPVFPLGTAGSWDDANFARGSLIATGSTFRYWYTGLSTSRNVWQIGYAEGLLAPPIVESDTAAFWHFDEASGSVVNDVSPNHNNGNAIGTAIVPGEFGNARQFNGMGDYVFVGDPANGSLDFANGESFTIEAWFKTTMQGTGVMLRKGLAPLPGYNIMILDGHVRAEVGNRGDGTPPDTLLRIVSENTYNDGSWHKVTYVRDQSQHRDYLYVDNALAATPVDDPIPFSLASDRPLTIGRWETVATYFAGSLDEIRISRSARYPEGSLTPDIHVSTTQIEFGIVPVGATSSHQLVISNLGLQDTLVVTGIESNNSLFNAVPTSFSVPPNSSQIVDVTYSPAAAQVDTGSLTIASNDPAHPAVYVHLRGQGFALGSAPLIGSIQDIPEDQGKQVRVRWYRSIYDSASSSTQITGYDIWRRVPGSPTLWDFIITVPAVQFSEYSYVAATLYDSTALTGIRWSVFRVSARTGDGQFFFSNPDSGYSVDNLPPHPPGNLVASIGAGVVNLSWDVPPDPDVMEYGVFRSNVSNFVPTEANRIGSPHVNLFADQNISGSTHWYYRIAAFDTAGNQSNFSNELAVIITDVQNGQNIPTVFSLRQNYPNPFNPSSVITYDVPETSHLTIKIYDMLGREVATLVDGVVQAGTHDVSWNAQNVSSGLYLCRMQAGEFADTMKMVLMK